jgi:hypothetical protein
MPRLSLMPGKPPSDTLWILPCSSTAASVRYKVTGSFTRREAFLTKSVGIYSPRMGNLFRNTP